jgi:hypothetical protein
MIERKLLTVEWDNPITLEEALENNGELDYGLYQIYARHIVFGPGSLVYVGKAEQQTFGTRFSQHEEWLREESDVQIRLGRPQTIDGRVFKGAEGWTGADEDEWCRLTSDAEALTIYWHSPPYNSACIWDYNGQPLWVQNTGDRGSLLPEYSSHWPSTTGPVRPKE